MLNRTLLCLFGAATALAATSLYVQNKGKITQDNAAYCNLFEGSLIISTFEYSFSLGLSPVKSVSSIGSKLESIAAQTPKTDFNTMWPNEAREAPEDLFGFPTYVVAGGFFFPGANLGAVTAVRTDKRTLLGYAKTKSLTNWKLPLSPFYHMVKFADVNGDNLTDIIAARAYWWFPLTTSASKWGELIWLEHPAATDDAWSSEWEEHTLVSGPETMFDIADLDGDGKFEIVAAKFFTPGLDFYYTTGTLADGPWVTRQVDHSLGAWIGASFVDLDLDGRKEILATNHVPTANASIAGIYAYEIPEDFTTGSFTRHALKTGLNCTLAGDNQDSPGLARTFHAYTPAPTDERPLILLAGDGAQNLLVLQATGSSGFQYETLEVITWNGTTGGPVVGDTDGDGWSEIFVPNWDSGYVQVWEFSNSTAAGAVKLLPLSTSK